MSCRKGCVVKLTVPLIRETAACYDGHPIILVAHPEKITFRLKRKCKGARAHMVSVPYERLFRFAQLLGSRE